MIITIIINIVILLVIVMQISTESHAESRGKKIILHPWTLESRNLEESSSLFRFIYLSVSPFILLFILLLFLPWIAILLLFPTCNVEKYIRGCCAVACSKSEQNSCSLNEGDYTSICNTLID